MTYSQSETNATGKEGDISHVEPDDIGVGMLTVVGALCAVVLVLIVVLLQAWFYNWQDALEAKRLRPDRRPGHAGDNRPGQLQRIEHYGWADEKKHVRAIPIQRAMELVVDEYGVKSGATGTGKESGRK